MDGIIQTIHWGTKEHPASTLPQWSDLWVAYPVSNKGRNECENVV